VNLLRSFGPGGQFGLLSGRQRDPLMELFQAASLRPQADAGDEVMFAANPNGTAQNQALGASLLAPAAITRESLPAATNATPKRERVSGWRLLDRVLGGETITGGLDAERARLEAEALKPQMLERQAENERIARALGPAALLAFRTNAPELGESLGYQYRPQVVAEGSALAIPGMGTTNVNERRTVVGDRVVGLGGNGRDPRELLTVSPSYDDETKRINATNPVTVAQDAQLRDPRTGALIAQGLTRPDVQNVAPGGEAIVLDSAGNVVNRVGSTQVKPMSDADQKAVAEAEGRLALLDNTVGRAQTILGQLDSGELNLNPLANASARVRNAVGASSPGSLNYDNLRNWAQEARNEILQSANGVQTEGDAVRALDVILSGSNDENVVRQAIQRYISSKQRTREVYTRDIARRSAPQGAASGVPPLPPGFELD